MAVRKQKDTTPQAGQVPNTGHMEETPAQRDGQGAQTPELTVRVFPIRNPKNKLRATANVNIAAAFACPVNVNLALLG